MISVTLYSKDDCQLCEKAIQYLENLQNVIKHELEIINIDGNVDLEKKYALDIPVISTGCIQLDMALGIGGYPKGKDCPIDCSIYVR